MKAEDKIYQAFFEQKEQRLYYSKLKRLTRLSHSSLQNALEKLTKSSILDLEKNKSNTFYTIRDKKLICLKFSEFAMKQFDNLNIGVKNPLKHFLKNIPKEIYTIIIFGSASRKEEQKNSDIDLLIVANKNLDLAKNKKEAQITSKYSISLFFSTVNQFIENKDDLIVQARKTGFPIYKEQNFYEVMLDEY